MAETNHHMANLVIVVRLAVGFSVIIIRNVLENVEKDHRFLLLLIKWTFDI